MRYVCACWLALGCWAAESAADLLRQAEAHLDKEQFAEAEAALRQALKAEPANVQALYRLGYAGFRQRKLAEARADFTAVVKTAPPAYNSRYFLGRIAPASGQGRDEIDFWLGATRVALKRPIASLRDLERLLARSPAHLDALQLATETYAGLSSSLWNDVAERQLETAPGWEIHGHVLESEGNATDALDAYRRSIALDGKRPGPRLAIGKILLARGKAEEAFTILRDELGLAPKDPEPLFHAGLAAIELGRHSEAAALLEPAARWAGRLPEAPLALAQVYLALKEPAKAMRAARQAVAAAPSSAAAHEILVAVLTQAGDTADLESEKLRWAKQRGR